MWVYTSNQKINHFIILHFMLPITLLFFNLIFASTDVQNFTDSDFSKSIREKPTFTVFYQQWCSFSTNFIKELETAVNSFSNDSIAFGKIDCAKSQLLCQAYVVGGYPTAKLFQFDLTYPFNFIIHNFYMYFL